MTFGAIGLVGQTVDIFLDAEFDDLFGASWGGEFSVGDNGDWSYHLRIGPGVPESGPGAVGVFSLIGICLVSFLTRRTA